MLTNSKKVCPGIGNICHTQEHDPTAVAQGQCSVLSFSLGKAGYEVVGAINFRLSSTSYWVYKLDCVQTLPSNPTENAFQGATSSQTIFFILRNLRSVVLVFF